MDSKYKTAKATNKPLLQTQPRKNQNLPKTDHGEKVKLAQALTYTCSLTSSSAGNSQGPLLIFPATVCKEEHPLLASSFSV